MNIKDSPLKLFVIVFILVLFFGITGSILLRSYNERKYPERFVNEAEIVQKGYDRSFPQIINEPPRSTVVGESFIFKPRLAPEGNDVNLQLLNAPEWLVLEDVVITGVPAEEGVFTFTLRIEKEGRYVDEEFRLIVIENSDE